MVTKFHKVEMKPQVIALKNRNQAKFFSKKLSVERPTLQVSETNSTQNKLTVEDEMDKRRGSLIEEIGLKENKNLMFATQTGSKRKLNLDLDFYIQR